MLPVMVERVVNGYIGAFDRLLPGRLEGFYLVGSTALEAFRPRRSDIDFVAVMSGRTNRTELRSLRAMNWWGSALAAWWTLASGNIRWPAGFNGIFVTWKDLALSPCKTTPIASQRAGRVLVGGGFDANPVTWQVLAQRGVVMRGPEPRAVTIHTDKSELHQWVAGNLSGYWANWSAAMGGRGHVAMKGLLPRGAAWGVLGAPRLHATLATSEILSKEQAGEYALNVFPEWCPLIVAALAYWRGDSSTPWHASPFERRKAAADFVAVVVADAAKRFNEADPMGSGS